MSGKVAAATPPAGSENILHTRGGLSRRRENDTSHNNNNNNKRSQHCEREHSVSHHSSSNSESNIDSPRLSDGERSSSTPTSIDESASGIGARKQLNEVKPTSHSVTTITPGINMENLKINDNSKKRINNYKHRGEPVDQKSRLKDEGNIDNHYQLRFIDREKTAHTVSPTSSILENESLVHTESYIHGEDNENVLLNKRISRISTRRSRQLPQQSRQSILLQEGAGDQVRKSIPFLAHKHSQILPLGDDGVDDKKLSNAISNRSMSPIHGSPINGVTAAVPSSGSDNLNLLKRSESATAEIKKMRVSLLHKRELRKKRKSFLMDDDRVLIGNKVSEGHVNFIIAYNMLTGIRVAVSRCSGIMKPLTPLDFKFTKKLAFDYHGNELTPSSQYAFKFKDYCPEVFRELRCLFGLDPADYLVSLTSKYILSELNSPGKSGSFFYFSRDYKYIIKTIHHTEHIHLRRHLYEYYLHVKNNPDTLLCQFYGLHRVKMPISFQNKIKHRKIYFLVMNNLFPPHLSMHSTYDLKGSTWGRLTKLNPQLISDSNYRPVLKDLNFLEEEERIKFGPLKKKKFLEQLRKDTIFLSNLNTMDYSLLLGIHDLSKSKDDDLLQTGGLISGDTNSTSAGLIGAGLETSIAIRNGNVIPHYFKQFEGGIRSSDAFNNDTNLVYYVGIIDCLTNYSIIKKLETFWRGLSHDLKVVSSVPPRDYAERLYDFVEDAVDPLPPRHYKDDPLVTNYRDQIE